MRQTPKQRRRQRRYYKKNRRKIIEKVKRRQEELGYRRTWYLANKDFIKARVALYRACRPDRVRLWWLRTNYPGVKIDKKDVLYDRATVRECKRIYREALRELRIRFGRDPDTGRRLE